MQRAACWYTVAMDAITKATVTIIMRSGAPIGRIGDMSAGPVIRRTNIGSEIVEKTVFENIFSAEWEVLCFLFAPFI